MLLLTCASLQPQATPSWLPGSLHEPRSQATSSDMRNLAHQPRRFCLALGPAPPRLLLLVPVSVLLGSSSPETLKFEERGGRPNCKLFDGQLRERQNFVPLMTDSSFISTPVLQTQYTSLIRSTIKFEQSIDVCFHCHHNYHPFKEKSRWLWHLISHTFWRFVMFHACSVHDPSCHGQISNSLWGAGGWTLCTVLKTSDPKCTYPYYRHTRLSFCLRSHT